MAGEDEVPSFETMANSVFQRHSGFVDEPVYSKEVNIYRQCMKLNTFVN